MLARRSAGVLVLYACSALARCYTDTAVVVHRNMVKQGQGGKRSRRPEELKWVNLMFNLNDLTPAGMWLSPTRVAECS